MPSMDRLWISFLVLAMRNQYVLMPAWSGTFLVFSGAAVVKNVAKKLCFLTFMLDRSSNHLGWLTTSDLIV